MTSPPGPPEGSEGTGPSLEKPPAAPPAASGGESPVEDAAATTSAAPDESGASVNGQAAAESSDDADAASAPQTATTTIAAPGTTAAPADRRWWRRSGPKRPPKKRSLWKEIPVLVIIALGLALLIKTFVVQPFYIPSGSMEKTLNVNDRVLVNKMIYHFRDPKRGEIVVFNIDGTGFESQAQPLAPPSNIISRGVRNLENLFGLGPNNKDFIKRVIGIGGDTVACCDDAGRVTVNGKPLDEPYVFEDDHRSFGPVTVPKGQLWVMGDHRGDSDDSRGSPGQPPNGTVPISKVVGQAFVRVWPLSDWRGYGVPKTFGQFTSGALGPEVGVLVPLFWWRRRDGRRSFRLPVLPAASGPAED
jgi:signal peptidase I